MSSQRSLYTVKSVRASLEPKRTCWSWPTWCQMWQGPRTTPASHTWRMYIIIQWVEPIVWISWWRAWAAGGSQSGGPWIHVSSFFYFLKGFFGHPSLPPPPHHADAPENSYRYWYISSCTVPVSHIQLKTMFRINMKWNRNTEDKPVLVPVLKLYCTVPCSIYFNYGYQYSFCKNGKRLNI